LSPAPKVALLYPSTFGDDGIVGGGERYALELGRHLALRVPTRLVTFADAPWKMAVDGLEVVRFPPIRKLGDHSNNPLSLAFLEALGDADVVHCMCWNTVVTDLATTWAKVCGKKVFVTDVGGGASRTLQRILPTQAWVDGFLLIAEAGGGAFANHRDRWRILLAGVDTQRYRPDPEANRQGVCLVARLLPHKGINYLIEAMPATVPLTIVGRPYDPTYFQLLQELARGKSVRFVTDADDDMVVRVLQTSAIGVLCSVERTIYGAYSALPELLGFAAMEAMACGTPVICTRVGALHELVEDGISGFLVPPNDAAALRAKIELLLAEPLRRREMGEAAARRIRSRFTWDAVVDRCLDAYRTMGRGT
jgi:glycosyltransferase involved in cell wall biosynthesis